MPRQVSDMIRTVGAPNPATLQMGAQRNNRILAAMQEGGSTLRQGMQNKSARDVTAMQQSGATNRAAMAERGAGERAQLGAETSTADREARTETAQMEQQGAGARQTEVLNARTTERQARELHDKNMAGVYNDFELAAREWREALATKEADRMDAATDKVLKHEAKLMARGQAGNLRGMLMLGSYMEKISDKDRAEASWRDSMDQMATSNEGVVKGQLAAKTVAQQRVAETLASNSADPVKITSDAASAMGARINPDVFESEEALANALADTATGFETYHALRNSYDVIEDSLTAVEDDILGGKYTETRQTGGYGSFGGPVSGTREVKQTMTGAKGREVAELRKWVKTQRTNLAALATSKRPLAEGKGTLGQLLLQWEANRRGYTPSAAARESRLRGQEPEEFRMELSDFFRSGSMDANHPIWKSYPELDEEDRLQMITEWEAERDIFSGQRAQQSEILQHSFMPNAGQ